MIKYNPYFLPIARVVVVIVIVNWTTAYCNPEDKCWRVLPMLQYCNVARHDPAAIIQIHKATLSIWINCKDQVGVRDRIPHDFEKTKCDEKMTYGSVRPDWSEDGQNFVAQWNIWERDRTSSLQYQ